jgi:hypothetical protein
LICNFLIGWSLGRSREQRFKLLLVVVDQILQVLHLVIVRLLQPLVVFLIRPDLVRNLLLKLLDLLRLFFVRLFKRFNRGVHVVLALLSHKSLSHAVGNGTLVEGLIGLDCHLDFIAHTNQQETAFCTIDSDLTDQFVKALGVKLLTDWADTGLTSLALLELVFKFRLKMHNVELSGGRWENILDPKLAALGVFTRRQN